MKINNNNKKLFLAIDFAVQTYEWNSNKFRTHEEMVKYLFDEKKIDFLFQLNDEQRKKVKELLLEFPPTDLNYGTEHEPEYIISEITTLTNIDYAKFLKNNKEHGSFDKEEIIMNFINNNLEEKGATLHEEHKRNIVKHILSF